MRSLSKFYRCHRWWGETDTLRCCQLAV